MVVDLGGIGALEPAVAAVVVGCWRARMGCWQVAGQAGRRRARTAQAAVEQDMYMDIAGHRGSMGLGREWMWTRDRERSAIDLGGAWDPRSHRTNLRRARERGQRDR